MKFTCPVIIAKFYVLTVEGGFDVSGDEEQLDLSTACLSTVENPQDPPEPPEPLEPLEEEEEEEEDGPQEENIEEENQSESVAARRAFPSRGKWMPGLKPGDIHKSGCSVEYDCKPCNRRLTGRVVYEKHLQSELHFKRVAQSQSSKPPEADSGHEHGGHYALRRKNPEAPQVGVKLVKDALEEDSDLWWLKRKRQDKSAKRCPTCQVR